MRQEEKELKMSGMNRRDGGWQMRGGDFWGPLGNWGILQAILPWFTAVVATGGGGL